MKKFRFYKSFEQAYGCEVEAETLEEAKAKAENAEWYDEEGGENWVTLERWKSADIPDDLDKEDDDEEIAEIWDNTEWNIEYNAYENYNK